jgi:hypothetical protein
MLASPELIAYLLDRGHLHPAAVVEGGLTLVDTSRRNHNAVVSTNGPTGLFVKQGRPGPFKPSNGWSGSGSLRHEAAVYTLLGSLSGRRTPGGIATALPRCHEFDPDRNLLILESLADAPDLGTYQTRTGRFPVTMGVRLGTALADLHERAVAAARRNPADFPGQVPWILGIDRPGWRPTVR